MIDLPLASSTWDDQELIAIQEVIGSGQFTMGRRVEEFERSFARWVGSTYAVMVNSGSSANLLGVAALMYHSRHKLKPGDVVLVPAVSWSTTYFPLHQLGLKLKFVDIDKSTLNIDLAQVEEAIDDSVKAIFCVNLLGNPCDYEALHKICERHGLLLIEDNCESMGATLNGKQAGTFGLFGTFSSFFSHHICTMEGGLVVTDDRELYHSMVSMRAHGWLRGQPEDSHLQVDLTDFEKQFRFVLPGYNLRPLEMSGAIGLKQLQKLPELVAVRRRNAKTFVDLFSDMPNVAIQTETGQSSWFGFAMMLNGRNSGRREEFVAGLSALGVDCRPIVTGNFVRNPVMKHIDHTVHGDLSVADEIDENGIFVGNHHFDVSEKLEKLAQYVTNF